MFSQSEDYSQLSNGDYNFLHSSSQSNSQFDLDAIPNKNPNLLNMGDLGTINEENPLTPIKLNFKDDSKKSLANNNQNISKSSKYSFTLILLFFSSNAFLLLAISSCLFCSNSSIYSLAFLIIFCETYFP